MKTIFHRALNKFISGLYSELNPLFRRCCFCFCSHNQKTAKTSLAEDHEREYLTDILNHTKILERYLSALEAHNSSSILYSFDILPIGNELDTWIQMLCKSLPHPNSASLCDNEKTVLRTMGILARKFEGRASSTTKILDRALEKAATFIRSTADAEKSKQTNLSFMHTI